MRKHGFDAACILVRVVEAEVDKAMGEADFGRKFEQGIIHVETAAVFYIEVKNIGPQAVVLNFIFLRTNLQRRLDAGQHVHSGIIPSLRFEFEQQGQFNKTESGLFQFNIAYIEQIFKLNVALIKGNGGQHSEIQQVQNTEVQDKAGCETQRRHRVHHHNGRTIADFGCILLLLSEIRTGGYSELRFIDGQKKTVVKKTVVVGYQVLTLPLYRFAVIPRFLKLRLRLSPAPKWQQHGCNKPKIKAVLNWFWAIHVIAGNDVNRILFDAGVNRTDSKGQR